MKQHLAMKIRNDDEGQIISFVRCECFGIASALSSDSYGQFFRFRFFSTLTLSRSETRLLKSSQINSSTTAIDRQQDRPPLRRLYPTSNSY